MCIAFCISVRLSLDQNSDKTKIPFRLKADQPHPRDYPHLATDYRHTDKNTVR